MKINSARHQQETERTQNIAGTSFYNKSQDTKEYSYFRRVPTGLTFTHLLLILKAGDASFKKGTVRKNLSLLVLLHRIRYNLWHVYQIIDMKTLVLMVCYS